METTKEIEFDENTHTYTRNKQNYVSVTTLLKNYGLSANYGNIPADVLKKAAERGTKVHKDLEDFIKYGIVNDHNSTDAFERYVLNRNINLTTARSEELVYNDKYLIAGTIDFQYTDGNESVIADFKTTSQIHWDSVTWQLSIYNYLKNSGDVFSYYMTTPKVFHMYGGRFEVRPLPLIPFDEVEKLLGANLMGLPYTYVPDYSQIMDTNEATIYKQLCVEVDMCKDNLKKLEARLKQYDEKLIDKMNDANVYNMTSGDLTIKMSTRNASLRWDDDKLKKLIADNNLDINDYKVRKGSQTTVLLKSYAKDQDQTGSFTDDVSDLMKGV